jgi:hypothetical protein
VGSGRERAGSSSATLAARISNGPSPSGGPQVRMPTFPLGASASAQARRSAPPILDLPEPERAHDRVPGSPSCLGRVRDVDLDVRETRGFHLIAAEPDHLLALVGRSDLPAASDGPGDSEHLRARPRARDEDPGPRMERELPDEVEVVGDEPRHPLVEVARRGAIPRGGHGRECSPTGSAGASLSERMGGAISSGKSWRSRLGCPAS